MDSARLARFSALPPLNRANQYSEKSRCKICGGHAAAFDIADFYKYCNSGNFYEFGLSGTIVSYLRCPDCGFIFTGFFDDWSAEEFSKFIYNEDYIRVDPEYLSIRPERMAREWAVRFAGCDSVRILDYGSGAGIFAERLRSAGVNIISYDPFSSPCRPEGRFDVVTCFEVLEHAPRPHDMLKDMKGFLDTGGCILFSTGIQPKDIMERRCSWWYIGPRNGHVSIFTENALACLAEAAGLRLYMGHGTHAFVPGVPSPAALAVLNASGPWVHRLVLGAPSAVDAGNAHAWHGIETAMQGRYRWTRVPQLEWRIAAVAAGVAQIQVVIPFLIEVEQGFAARCTLTVGSQRKPLSVADNRLVATVQANDAMILHITLHTPPPRSPSDLRGAPDPRPLGLAIRLRDGGGE